MKLSEKIIILIIILNISLNILILTIIIQRDNLITTEYRRNDRDEIKPSNEIKPSLDEKKELDEKKDWKVYKNEEWKYLLKHPKDWTIKIDVENKGVRDEEVVRQTMTFRSPEETPIFISVWENLSKKTLLEWFEEYYKIPYSDEIDNPINTSVNGRPAISFQEKNLPQAFDEWVTIFIANDLVYEITYLNNDENQTLEIYRAIIDSFVILP